MDAEKFARARETALFRNQGASGIGTLSEKTLHAALKIYYEADPDSREVRIGGYVADIVGEDGIVEIQTRSFERLREKLQAFLPVARVTVVYPVPVLRYLCWVDPETGEIAPRKKTSARGIPADVFPELYKIKTMLTDPNFTLRLVTLEVTDYKYLDGYGQAKKIRATRGERVPEQMFSQQDCRTPQSYLSLLPELPEPFTVKQLAKALKRKTAVAQAAANVLFTLGALRRVGKEKGAYLYVRCADDGEEPQRET